MTKQTYKGNLTKMNTKLDQEVLYSLKLGDSIVNMNELIGKEIQIEYHHTINCIKCNRITKTSFGQGYCYPCFISAPETEDCVLRPELCEAHLGIARDMKYAEEHCLIDHIVYLALSSNVKVGVTRHTQIPVRWIDQGAWKVIKLAITPNRNLAGNIEVALKQHLTDKTNWRHMLTNKLDLNTDLLRVKDEIVKVLHEDFKKYVTDDDSILEINYPVMKFPEKVKSINLDKTAIINDTLMGIKGQYLIFDSGNVLNIRKHSGYLISLSYS